MSARTPLRLAALAAGALALAAPLLPRGTAPPLLLNLTGSLPGTVYVRVKREPKVGDVVAVCLPEDLARFALERDYIARGRRCPGGASPLLKRIAALSGADVRYDGERLVVDGVAQPESAIRQEDSRGRAMPVIRAPRYVVGAGEVLLVNPHALSFDSRYFGAVPIASLLGVYRALIPSFPFSQPTQGPARTGEGEAGAVRVRGRAPTSSLRFATSPSLSPRAQRGACVEGRTVAPPPARVPRVARDDKTGERMRINGMAPP